MFATAGPLERPAFRPGGLRKVLISGSQEDQWQARCTRAVDRAIAALARKALIDLVAKHRRSPDAVCVIRGGGAVNDMTWLNDYALARWVAAARRLSSPASTTSATTPCSTRSRTPAATPRAR